MRAIRASKAASHVTTMQLMISDLRLMTGLLLRARPLFESYSKCTGIKQEVKRNKVHERQKSPD